MMPMTVCTIKEISNYIEPLNDIKNSGVSDTQAKQLYQIR